MIIIKLIAIKYWRCIEPLNSSSTNFCHISSKEIVLNRANLILVYRYVNSTSLFCFIFFKLIVFNHCITVFYIYCTSLFGNIILQLIITYKGFIYHLTHNPNNALKHLIILKLWVFNLNSITIKAVNNSVWVWFSQFKYGIVDIY